MPIKFHKRACGRAIDEVSDDHWLRWHGEQAPCRSVIVLFVFWSNLIDIIPQRGAKTMDRILAESICWSDRLKIRFYGNINKPWIAPPLDFLKISFLFVLWITRETEGFFGLSSLKRVYYSRGQVFSSSSSKREDLFPSRLDLPTSRAQTSSQTRRARAGDFFLFALGPTTGTGNEKRRTLSLRKGVITEQKKIFRFLLIKSVHEKSLKN